MVRHELPAPRTPMPAQPARNPSPQKPDPAAPAPRDSCDACAIPTHSFACPRACMCRRLIALSPTCRNCNLHHTEHLIQAGSHVLVIGSYEEDKQTGWRTSCRIYGDLLSTTSQSRFGRVDVVSPRGGGTMLHVEGLSKNGNVQLTCDYNDKSGVLRMVAERMLQHQREGTVDSYTLVPYVMQLPSAS